jgi:RNA polymerase sigma-70 factor (ECF subfamily)
LSLSDDEHGLSGRVKAEKGFDFKNIEWKLQLAIQTLPDKQRAVFNLRYYDEMPYEKMSEVLETSVGALKASYHHAAKKVSEFMLKEN